MSRANPVVEVALRLLPVGSRARYREEWAADLGQLRGLARIRYVLGVVIAVPALRDALVGPHLGLDGHRVRLSCRLGLAHHWRSFRTTDNEPYRRCERCGKDDDRATGPDQALQDSLAVAASVYRVTQ